LVNELFDNKYLIISEEKEKNLWAQQLFMWAHKLIRNDRWHNFTLNKQTEFSCDNIFDCLNYLWFINLLLNFLDKNLAIKPIILSYNIIGLDIEITMEKVYKWMQVFINNTEAKIINTNINTLKIENKNIKWKLKVYYNWIESNEIEFIIGKENKNNIYEVVKGNITLFKDKKCENEWDIKWVLLKVNEGWKDRMQIFPTNIDYNEWDYVEWWFDYINQCWESWAKYESEIIYTFTWSLFFNWKVYWKSSIKKDFKIEITSPSISAYNWSNIILWCKLHKSDKYHCDEENISEICEWKSNNNKIGYIQKWSNILYIKNIWEVEISCTYKNLHSSKKIKISTPISNNHYLYYKNKITHLQQIDINEQGDIFISNQSNTIYKLDWKTWKKKEILKLPNEPFSLNPPQIDCLRLDIKNELLYFSSISWNFLWYYDFNKNKIKKVISWEDIWWTIKSIAIDENGQIYTTTMKNIIRVIDKEWNIIKSIKTKFNTIDIDIIEDKYIIVWWWGWIEILNVNWEETKDILFPDISISDFKYKDWYIYLCSFHNKKIYKYNIDKKEIKEVVDLWDKIPWWICIDKDNNLYISIFSWDNWIYKIIN
jgi:hypothetical protein